MNDTTRTLFIVLRDYTPAAWNEPRDHKNGLAELVQFDTQDVEDIATFATEDEALAAIGRTAVALSNCRSRFPDFKVKSLMVAQA